MAIGFPVVVGEATHSVLIGSRPIESGKGGGIWFNGLPAEVRFPQAYRPTFARLRPGIRLELVVHAPQVVAVREEEPLFQGRSAVTALLLASHFDCAPLSRVLVSGCCVPDTPGHFDRIAIIPLGGQSQASIKSQVLGFGYSLFMHEDDLAGLTSLTIDDWQPESPSPQLVRIPKGMLLGELAMVLKVRSFDEIKREQQVVRVERQEQLASDSLAILRRMEMQLADLSTTEKPGNLPPDEILGPAVSLEAVMLDIFVPVGVNGGITSYGGYNCILKSDYPSVAMLLSNDYIDLQFDPDPELLGDLRRIYILQQTSAVVLPYQEILDLLSIRFARKDFGTVRFRLTPQQARDLGGGLSDLPCPSIDLSCGSNDDYFEMEIYPTLNEAAVNRSMKDRVIIEDPDFISTLGKV